MSCTFCELDVNRTIGDVRVNQIMYESQHFRVFPGLGQLAEGYLMLTTREHYRCIGEAPSSLYPELEAVQARVRNVLTEEYGRPVFFEHGPSSDLRGGACIEHAHLHALPAEIELVSELSRRFTGRQIDSLEALKREFEAGVPYIFVEQVTGERYVFRIPNNVPSQFMRRVVAERMEKPERWDWGAYLGLEELRRTNERLRGKF